MRNAACRAGVVLAITFAGHALSLAPAGTAKWGPDQCRNDPDGSVDFDERLRITGVSSGRYDAEFTDKTGRTCTVSNIDIKAGGVFSIGKEALEHCVAK
jgi:hypothetical protein